MIPTGLPTLVLTVGSRACAIPLTHVIETMRPLPIESVADMPPFVLGVSIVRGAPIPVVSVSALVGAPAGRPPTRFVTLLVDTRVLAVDAVEGIVTLDAATLEAMPPLLAHAGAGVVAAIAPLDDRLLLVLQAARIVPTREPS
jgi:purine-binding chemotaxis protein CheW